MHNKAKFKISHIFALVMAGIITVSMGLTLTIIYIMIHFHFNLWTGAVTSSSFIALLSIAVGTLISTYVSKRMLRPIFRINDAAKKVAMGDFTVRLEEKNTAKEIEEIARSFNVMVRELSNTETLRNDFVSNVSHEFKTPLSAIQGYVTLLQDDGLEAEEKDKYIRYIMGNTARLTKLTQNILSMSRLENQEIVLQKEQFLLDEQIRRILLGYENRWEEKNLTIDLNLESIRVFENYSLLAQVWSNLIDNAIKFSRQDGNLTIGCWMEENKVVVTVKDDGIGMEEEVAAHAFDKFYQGENSHAVQGNGLGLALVKRIVTLCAGTIELYSEKEKGTEVTVLLNFNKMS